MLRFHVLRHALTPALCLQFASLGELIGGSLLAEKVFSYPGLGQATVDAGLRGDIPLLMGIVLFCTLLVIGLLVAWWGIPGGPPRDFDDGVDPHPPPVSPALP